MCSPLSREVHLPIYCGQCHSNCPPPNQNHMNFQQENEKPKHPALFFKSTLKRKKLHIYLYFMFFTYCWGSVIFNVLRRANQPSECSLSCFWLYLRCDRIYHNLIGQKYLIKKKQQHESILSSPVTTFMYVLSCTVSSRFIWDGFLNKGQRNKVFFFHIFYLWGCCLFFWPVWCMY
jgi:hypothetical protein